MSLDMSKAKHGEIVGKMVGILPREVLRRMMMMWHMGLVVKWD